MEKYKAMTLRLTKDIYENVLHEAKKENRSIHNQVLTILIKYFENSDGGK